MRMGVLCSWTGASIDAYRRLGPLGKPVVVEPLRLFRRRAAIRALAVGRQSRSALLALGHLAHTDLRLQDDKPV